MPIKTQTTVGFAARQAAWALVPFVVASAIMLILLTKHHHAKHLKDMGVTGKPTAAQRLAAQKAAMSKLTEHIGAEQFIAGYIVSLVLFVGLIFAGVLFLGKDACKSSSK